MDRTTKDFYDDVNDRKTEGSAGAPAAETGEKPEIPAKDPEVIPEISPKEIRIPATAVPAAVMMQEPAAAKTAQMMQRTFQKGKLLMRAMTHHPARQTAHQILQTQLTQKKTRTPQQLLLRRKLRCPKMSSSPKRPSWSHREMVIRYM